VLRLFPDPLVNAIVLLAAAMGIGALLVRGSPKSTHRIVGAALVWETIALLLVAWFASYRAHQEPVGPWIITVALIALSIIPGATYWRVRAENAAAKNPESARRLRWLDSSFAKYVKIALLSLPLGSCAYIVGSILGSTGEGWSPSTDAGRACALLAVIFAWVYVSRQDARSKAKDGRQTSSGGRSKPGR